MPWIDPVPLEHARGRLRRIYDAALARAGKIFNVVAIQSQQPRVLESSMGLYLRIMKADDEPLTRAQREMLAVTVSRINACAY
jgi:alkylhydroperoxidase family enzyme